RLGRLDARGGAGDPHRAPARSLAPRDLGRLAREPLRAARADAPHAGPRGTDDPLPPAAAVRRRPRARGGGRGRSRRPLAPGRAPGRRAGLAGLRLARRGRSLEPGRELDARARGGVRVLRRVARRVPAALPALPPRAVAARALALHAEWSALPADRDPRSA